MTATFQETAYTQRAWNCLLTANGISHSDEMPEDSPAEELPSDADEPVKMNWADLPQAVQEWIIANPKQTAFYAVNGVVFFYPALMTAPFLWAFGFGAQGPIAGKYPTGMTFGWSLKG